MDREETKQKINNLVRRYEEDKKSGKLKYYTEEDTKKGFILPLFEILGWNIFERNEVSSEETISSQRVDYGFYINGRIKFYLEAKKFNVDLHREDFANQTIRYSFNKGATWAILTNFETLIVFNAQNVSKDLSDKRLFTIHYNEYIERFDELELLSKEAQADNLLDKYGEKIGKKMERVFVGELLYKDIQTCRDMLAKNFSIWNEKIDSDLLDEGVQKLLDRIIFIRVAEDRGVEPPTLIPMYREWMTRFAGGGKEHFYQWMIKKFRELDKIYNSDLFSPHPFEQWEDYSDTIIKVIKILHGKEGYYEYDFKAISSDILGAVYENYLSHRLSKSKKGLTVSEDAKKRKKQGIYYTPGFIVDYIIKNTLGPILDKCQSIEDIKKIKVLDPACGSGSFLIKATDMIAKKYEEFGARVNDELVKMQILTENIYGVDLDQQAVEITRLNLLINALTEKMPLPFLENIKNGNSLIFGTDKELEKQFGKNFRDKKPFNWQEEFPEVFKQGGFDVIIGNPPYVNLANIRDEAEREYLKAEFKTAKNKSDLYGFFTERAVGLLKNNGELGFIFSNSWLGTDSFSKFRQFLIENTIVRELVKLPPNIFEGATVTTILIFLKKEKAKPNYEIPLFQYVDGNFLKLRNKLSYERIKCNPGYSFSFEEETSFRIETIPLGEIAEFSLGVKTSNDERFILNEKKDKDTYPLLRGKDVFRYSYEYANKWLWYKPETMMEKVGAGPRKIEYFLTDKILFRSITGGSIVATLDQEKYFTNDKVHILYESNDYSLKFILGLVNSKLIDKWLHSTFGSLLEIKINQLQNIPIPLVFGSGMQDRIVKLVDKILNLNKELHELPENSEKWLAIKSEIEKTDRKIDQEVYKLYGLTPEEIKIVEGN